MINIRKAVLSDRDGIAEIIKSSLGYTEMNDEKFAARFDRILSDENFTTLVATDDNAVVGFIGARKEFSYEQDDDYMRILAFAIANDYQNKGIGKKMITDIESIAKADGIHLLTLSSNFRRTDAHAFYEKQGYAKTSYAFKKKL